MTDIKNFAEPMTLKADEGRINDLQLNQQRELSPTSQTENKPILYVRNAWKSYGKARNSTVVLKGYNMTVSRGIIYGLLGASGCGKTTLLSCILGQKKLDSGEIWALGGAPGTKNCGIPGPQVGYMPQEIGLYVDFTIQETVKYFGWILGMSIELVQERFQTLTKLLMLPNTNQRVKTLSGGEQRRVSLAVTLLHKPDLLLLDEPTAGVDPLLRETIWKFLIRICKEENTAVIITTHYIEEARRANIIGLMRHGELLAEEAPEQLLARHNSETLEDVFFKLCLAQSLNRRQSNAIPDSNTSLVINANSTTKLSEEFVNTTLNIPVVNKNISGLTIPELKHLKPLIWKNAMWWMRNTSIFLYMIAVSPVVVMLCCLCAGTEPHNLAVAVVNYETNNDVTCNNGLTCDSMQFSCNYLKHVKEHSVKLMYYNSEDDAIKSVLHGSTYASVVIRHNYSTALRVRINDMREAKPWDIESSDIYITTDVSNKYTANFLKLRFYNALRLFLQDYLAACNLSRKALETPVNYEVPVYGDNYPVFTDFVVPGLLLSIVFVTGIFLTVSTMFVERTEAGLERTFVSGVTETELLIAHIVCESVVMIIGALLAVICAFFIFNLTQKGSLMLVISLTLLTGFCGICFGLSISCVCNTEIEVIVTASGIFFPTITLSGIIWPVEGIHHILKPFAFIFPLTKTTESIRSILQRNWDLHTETVYMGFISISLWSICFMIVSVLYLKYKKS